MTVTHPTVPRVKSLYICSVLVKSCYSECNAGDLQKLDSTVLIVPVRFVMAKQDSKPITLNAETLGSEGVKWSL